MKEETSYMSISFIVCDISNNNFPDSHVFIFLYFFKSMKLCIDMQLTTKTYPTIKILNYALKEK